MKKILQILLIIHVFIGCDNSTKKSYFIGDWQYYDIDSNYFEMSFINDTVGIFNSFLNETTYHNYTIKADTLILHSSVNNLIWKSKIRKSNYNRFDLKLTYYTISAGDTTVTKFWANLKRIPDEEIKIFDVKNQIYIDTTTQPTEYNEFLQAAKRREYKYYKEINNK